MEPSPPLPSAALDVSTRKRSTRSATASENDEQDLAIIRAVALFQPHTSPAGQTTKRWQQTAAHVVASSGSELTTSFCRARFQYLLYQLVLEDEFVTKDQWVINGELRKLVAVEAAAIKRRKPSSALLEEKRPHPSPPSKRTQWEEPATPSPAGSAALLEEPPTLSPAGKSIFLGKPASQSPPPATPTPAGSAPLVGGSPSALEHTALSVGNGHEVSSEEVGVDILGEVTPVLTGLDDSCGGGGTVSTSLGSEACNPAPEPRRATRATAIATHRGTATLPPSSSGRTRSRSKRRKNKACRVILALNFSSPQATDQAEATPRVDVQQPADHQTHNHVMDGVLNQSDGAQICEDQVATVVTMEQAINGSRSPQSLRSSEASEAQSGGIITSTGHSAQAASTPTATGAMQPDPAATVVLEVRVGRTETLYAQSPTTSMQQQVDTLTDTVATLTATLAVSQQSSIGMIQQILQLAATTKQSQVEIQQIKRNVALLTAELRGMQSQVQAELTTQAKTTSDLSMVSSDLQQVKDAVAWQELDFESYRKGQSEKTRLLDLERNEQLQAMRDEIKTLKQMIQDEMEAQRETVRDKVDTFQQEMNQLSARRHDQAVEIDAKLYQDLDTLRLAVEKQNQICDMIQADCRLRDEEMISKMKTLDWDGILDGSQFMETLRHERRAEMSRIRNSVAQEREARTKLW